MTVKKKVFNTQVYSKFVYLFLCICICIPFLSCCSFKNTDAKGDNVDYTIVTGSEIPDELKKIIKKRRNKAFELSYNDGEYLYVAKGYGQKDTNGYDITVKGFYKSDDNLIFDTCLNGPKTNENVSVKLSYPYIVIKTEYMNNSIIFK